MKNLQLALSQWLLSVRSPEGNYGFWMVLNKGQQEMFYGDSMTKNVYKTLFDI